MENCHNCILKRKAFSFRFTRGDDRPGVCGGRIIISGTDTFVSISETEGPGSCPALCCLWLCVFEVCFRRVECRAAVCGGDQDGFAPELFDIAAQQFVEGLPAHLLLQAGDRLQLSVPGFVAGFGDDLRDGGFIGEAAGAPAFHQFEPREGGAFDRCLQGVGFRVLRPAYEPVQRGQDLRDLRFRQRRGRGKVALCQLLVVFRPLPAGGFDSAEYAVVSGSEVAFAGEGQFRDGRQGVFRPGKEFFLRQVEAVDVLPPGLVDG